MEDLVFPSGMLDAGHGGGGRRGGRVGGASAGGNMRPLPIFEPVVNDLVGLFTAFSSHFQMERELLDRVVAQRRASPQLVKKVVDSMDSESK